MLRLASLAAAAVVAAGLAHATPDRWASEWPDTNFDKTTIDDWSEIMSGGPPKDGIPAISDPDFMPAARKATSPAPSR